MKKISLTTKIFLGLFFGIIVGLLLTNNASIATTYIKPFGTLFLNMIKMIIVPLVFSSLVVGTASVGDVKSLGRIGGKTMGYFMVTTAMAIVIGLILGTVMAPGQGLSIPTDVEPSAQETPSIIDTLINIIPSNPLKSLVDGSMLQIIVFAIFLGIGATIVGESLGKPFLSFFNSLAEIMYKITEIVMKFAPIGVFGLITPVVAENGPSVLLPLIKVIAAVYLGCVLHAVLVYGSLIKVLANFNPIKFFKGAASPAITAFSTSSSSGTLPITMKAAKEKLGIPDKIASFVLPLGATVNMDGTALYQGVCALFIAQVYGLNLSIGQMLTIVLTATLGSIGTAGVPGAGMIMLTIVLESVGLPLEGIALIAGVDRVLDMARTCINVVGDLSAAVVVSKSEGVLMEVSETAGESAQE
jgi:Na+/H+-dicarboxylate symporter